VAKRRTALSAKIEPKDEIAPLPQAAANEITSKSQEEEEDDFLRSFAGSLFKYTGANDLGLALQILNQTKSFQLTTNSSEFERKTVFETTDAMMLELNPRDVLEGTLISYMIGARHAFVVTMQDAMDPNRDHALRIKDQEMAMKWSRHFLQQMEALSKYRGKGQQKITVEHIKIEAGAQAIVGCVNTTALPDEKTLDKTRSPHSEPVTLSAFNTDRPKASPTDRTTRRQHKRNRS
jgi:hypothetical protein